MFYCSRVFFFSDYALPPGIFPLSLHDALPISSARVVVVLPTPPFWLAIAQMRIGLLLHGGGDGGADRAAGTPAMKDRKSTRLNSSHVKISYAVFCLKKKKNN